MSSNLPVPVPDDQKARRPVTRPPRPSLPPTQRLRIQGERRVERVIERKLQMLLIEERTQGPIPPPSMLKGYQEAVPDGGNRILAMAEKESKHRRKIESNESASGIRQGWAGMVAALVVTLTAFGASMLFAYWGHPGWGATIGGILAGERLFSR